MYSVRNRGERVIDKYEADYIVAHLAMINPGKSCEAQVVEKGPPKRYIVIGPDGFKVQFGWQLAMMAAEQNMKAMADQLNAVFAQIGQQIAALQQAGANAGIQTAGAIIGPNGQPLALR